MISTTEFRSGLRIDVEGEPYSIVEFQHVKPGKGGAFVRTKLRNLKTNNMIDKTFRSGERFDEPSVDEKKAQYLYAEGTLFHFMDTETYDQFFVLDKDLGEKKDFLKENMVVDILFYQGKPLTIELPIFVTLKVARTDPGLKGDTATGGTKPAVLETGAAIKVPLHISEGDLVKIDTRTGGYVERVRAETGA